MNDNRLTSYTTMQDVANDPRRKSSTQRRDGPPLLRIRAPLESMRDVATAWLPAYSSSTDQ
jgi:hypothetical protein